MPKSKVEVTSSFLKAPTLKKDSQFEVPRKRRKSNIQYLYAFILFIIFLFLGGVLNIKNYKVSGNTQVTTQDIEDLAKKSAGGQLIVSANPVSIEKELLDKFSLLSFARVTKELPSTLSIEVKERSKSAVIKTLENTVLVSDDGTVIEELTDDQIQNNKFEEITVVKMIDEPKRSKGYKFDSAYIKNLSTLINSWQNYKSTLHLEYKSPSFVDIIADKDKNIKFILADGGTAVLSLSNSNINVEDTVSDLLTTYNKLSATKKVKTIDIRFENKLVVTYF